MLRSRYPTVFVLDLVLTSALLLATGPIGRAVAGEESRTSRQAYQGDDSELAEVRVSATRIQPTNARDWVLCTPETYIEAQLTPAEQAREDNDPDVRPGREAVDRYLIADMTRDHFALSLNYGHSEDHGEEIWFFYSVDRTCSAFKNVTHDNVTMALKRKTGEIRYMAP